MAFLKKNSLWLLGSILLFFVVISAGHYNSFVTQNNAVDGAWKQVEVQYQRRFDLIPNLVEATKGLMAQEQKVFSDIANARAAYAGAQTQESKVAAAAQVESALGRLLVIVENYPQLKSDQAVLRLQDELAGTENRVAVERKRYNDLVVAYNTNIQTLPGALFANLFGFKPRTYFETSPEADKAPVVKF